MTFPILGGNGAVATYSIDNSLRFNDDDDAQLSRTPSGTSTTHTFSLWIKRGNLKPSGRQTLIAIGDGSGNISWLELNNDRLAVVFDGSGTYWPKTDAVFRDVSAWYHIFVAVDTTQATASDRCKFYINGVQFTDTNGTFPPQNHTVDYDACVIGYNPSDEFDGYIAECHFIDGQQLSPTDFGEFDSASGIWKPISYSGTYGTNGFYLDFENSGSLGADQSGNGNNFTPTNLASTDQTTDTPTNNFATLNPLVFTSGGANYSEGNVKVNTNDATRSGGVSTQGVSVGKWYWEIKLTSGASNSQLGISYNPQELTRTTTAVGETADSWSYVPPTGKIRNNAVDLFSASTLADSDIMNIALDLDNNYVYFGKNGTWQNSGDPTSGASGTGGFSLTAGEEYFFIGGDRTIGGGATQEVNFGNPSFSISSGNSDDNGYGNFEYAPPSGYLALCTQNLATELSPTIDDGSEYFQTALWTGTGASLEITNNGNSDLQPDFFWGKSRSNGSGHTLIDSSRGLTKYLVSNDIAGEATNSTTITSFNTDGFTLGTDSSTTINFSGRTYVGWQWKANAGSTSSNSDGDITATVQANPTAGFSVVTYTGNGNASPQTVGHGLGKKCQTVILKTRSVSGQAWRVYQDVVSASAGGNLFLNSTDALITSDPARVTATSSSTFTLTGYTSPYNGVNQSGSTYVAYCFAEIEGYSKFGSYTGNGSTDGTFVYTGFRPQWIMWKRTNSTADWEILDDKINPFNEMKSTLEANTSDAVGTETNGVDMLSNGFKHRNSYNSNNASGGTYIYMAFAESPFVSSTAIPVTAR